MGNRTAVLKPLIFCTALLLVWAPVAPFLAGRLVVERPLEHADAILVLAGSAAFVERTHKAALVYKAGVAPRVILTNGGDQPAWSRKVRRYAGQVEQARRELIANGVPESAIEILPSRVTGTMVEARLVGVKAAESRWAALLIVTSAYHTRRALWAFDRAFAEAASTTKIGIVSAESGPETPPLTSWWLAWRGWQDVAGEYLKSAYYRLVY